MLSYKTKIKFLAKNTILATGHSARDIFKLLDKKSIEIKTNLLPWELELNILKN